MSLQTLKHHISIKRFMVGYLFLFLAISSFAANSLERFWKGLAIAVLYSLFDLAWTYIRGRKLYLPVSSLISGLILSLVVAPAPSPAVIIFLPLLAVASKHLLKFGRPRHIFNPAAFALGFLGLFGQPISWWGVAWGRTPYLIALAAGLFILWRQGRFRTAVSFLTTYIFLLGIVLSASGLLINQVIGIIKLQIFDGTLAFFATVMLIEPITSAFSAKNNRIVYGALVGFFAVLLSYIDKFGPGADPLIHGLLLGNFAASMIYLPKKISNSPKIK